MVNNKIIVRDWGSLVHLGESPCREETMAITLHYREKKTGVKRHTDTKVCSCFLLKLNIENG